MTLIVYVQFPPPPQRIARLTVSCTATDVPFSSQSWKICSLRTPSACADNYSEPTRMYMHSMEKL